MLDNTWDGYLTGVIQYVGKRWTQLADQDDTGTRTARQGIGGPLSVNTLSFDPGLDAYENVNLRLGMRNANWDAAIYLNNATDERAQLSFDRERDFTARQGYRVNQPRTVGVAVRYDF